MHIIYACMYMYTHKHAHIYIPFCLGGGRTTETGRARSLHADAAPGVGRAVSSDITLNESSAYQL